MFIFNIGFVLGERLLSLFHTRILACAFVLGVFIFHDGLHVAKIKYKN